MTKRIFSKISGCAIVLSFLLTFSVVGPVFAETRIKKTLVGAEGSSLKEWVANFFRQFEGHEIARKEAPAPNAQDLKQDAENTNTEDQKIASHSNL